MPPRRPAPGADQPHSGTPVGALPLLTTSAPTPPHPSGLSLVAPAEPERADAARNRRLLLEAATRLIDRHGASAVTMDGVAREAGVGKGTVFRRFGNRSGLMLALLDHSESQLQQAFMSGPAPLGPGAPGEVVDPLDRLLAYGRARLATAASHLDILLEAEEGGPQRFLHPTRNVSAIHTRTLLRAMGFRGNLELMCIAVLAPLDPPAVYHLHHHDHMPFDQIADDWESMVRSLQPPKG
jgi:AcrR family transcriptional regulator